MLPRFFKKKLLPCLMVFGFVCLGSVVNAYAEYTFFQELAQPGQELAQHVGAVSQLAFSPNGNMMVSSRNGGSANVFSLKDGSWEFKQCLKRERNDNWVYKLAVSSDGETIFLGFYSGNIEVWNQNSDSIYVFNEILNNYQTRNNPITGLAISQNKQTIISCSYNSRNIWSFQGDQWQSEVIDRSIFTQGNCFYLDAELQTLVSRSNDRGVQIWNLSNNGSIGCVGTFTLDFDPDSVTISPDQTTIVLSNTAQILILNLVDDEWTINTTLDNPFSALDIPKNIALSQTTIALWLSNGQIQIIEKDNGEWRPLEQIVLDESSIDKPYSTIDMIRSIAVSPDKMLAIGYKDGSIKMYSSENVFGRCGKKRKTAHTDVPSDQDGTSDESLPKRAKTPSDPYVWSSYCTLI